GPDARVVRCGRADAGAGAVGRAGARIASGRNLNRWRPQGAGGSDRRFVFFAGADAHHTLHRRHEDLAVTDLAGARGVDDGFDAAVHVFVLDHDLHLDLRQKVDHVLGTAVELGVAFLAAET